MKNYKLKIQSYLILIQLCFLINAVNAQDWHQLGDDFFGEAVYEGLGNQVEISDDGTIVAYGVHGESTVEQMAGAVRVFSRDDSVWNQMGTDLTGDGVKMEFFGYSISMSADGHTVAGGGIDTNGPGIVKVWNWDGSSWVQKGNSFVGANTGDKCGQDVSLSASGDVLAISSQGEVNGSGNKGVVRIYNWDGSTWNQMGNDIESWGTAANFGQSIDLDSLGHTIVIGASSDDAVQENAGSATVYAWDGSNWSVLGSTFNDSPKNGAAGDIVRLSNDGRTMVYSSHWSAQYLYNAGALWIYEYDGTNWNPKGDPIYGIEKGDYLGVGLDISGDGNRIAIGSNYNVNHSDASTTNGEGSVQVLDWDGTNWNIVGDTIWGGITQYRFGKYMSLTADGNSLVVGCPENKVLYDLGGAVRVYTLNEPEPVPGHYWVGDGGNWSDVSHWATTSGGSTFHTSPPGPDDDVFFDSNSFTTTDQVVTVDMWGECKNMDWTGVSNMPDLAGNNYLDIYGSLKMSPDITCSHTGIMGFLSDTTGNTIDFADLTLNFEYIEFLDVDGEWTLESDVNLVGGTSGLSFVEGTFNAGDNTINVQTFVSLPSDDVVLNLDSSTINIYTAWSLIYYLQISFNAGTSTINIYDDNLFDLKNFDFYNLSFHSTDDLMDYSIMGNSPNKFNTLSFNEAKSVTLPASDTLQVNSLEISGNCMQSVTFKSDKAGAAAIIHQDSGTVVNEYLNLKDIEITGGANYVANYSSDLGGVTNWTINSPIDANNFYWVGGTGEWEDPNHWAFTSGGTPNGTCTPGATDNVYFDSNSFTDADQVVSSSSIITCNKMEWVNVTGAPSFKPGLDMYIGTSFILDTTTAMAFSFTKDLFFTSDSMNNELRHKGHSLRSTDMYITGAGDWSIYDSLSVKSLHLNNGSFTSNNYPITAKNAINSSTSNVRSIILGSSKIKTASWNMSDTTALNLETDNITLEITGNKAYMNDLAYKTVILSGTSTTRMYGNAQIDSLALNTGLKLILQAGKTITINELTAQGDCIDIIAISSNISDSAAYISNSTRNVDIVYASLKDIHAIGGASFTCNNGLDYGNNDGWVINELAPTTYYWVGHHGNWSDPNHWALTSNGPGNGSCIPKYYDDVVFDANSFDNINGTVTIDQAAYCRNFDFSETGGWGRVDGTGNLHVYGSFDITSIYTYHSFQGKLFFNSDATGNVINTDGKLMDQYVYFDGNGEWNLASDFNMGSINKDLYFIKGTLNTNDYDMQFFSLHSDKPNHRVWNMGSSTINCAGFWFIENSTNMTINPGTSEVICGQIHCIPGGLNYYKFSSTVSSVFKLYGSSTFMKLSVPNAPHIVLEGGHTQTIDTLELIDGTDCNNMVWIESGNSDPAYIHSVNGGANGNYWNINNVVITGGAPYIANNSVGSGNISGWTFNTPMGVDHQIVCNEYTWIDGITYTESNDAATFKIAGGAVSGCDSLVRLDLTIMESDSVTVDVKACESYDFDGNVLTTSGQYQAVYSNQNGCDSVVTLHLTIFEPSTGTDVISACGSYKWIDGITYNESNNTATYTLTNSGGCDSVVTLNLTILESSTGTDVITACESYTWIDGITYTESNNTATDTLTNSVGCDSVVTLDLNILKQSYSYDTIAVCNNYEWNGNTYIESGDYQLIFTNTVGCDSIAMLNLTITDPCDTTSVTELLEGKIWLYPNPVHDHLVIELPSADFSKIKIMDITGNLVLSKSIDGDKLIIRDLIFASGTYILRIFGKEQSVNSYLLIKN